MSFLFLEGRRTTYEEATEVIRWTKQLQERKPTLVEDSALRSTVTVCSWAEMSSIVRGRLAGGSGQMRDGAEKGIHYFSTQGCSAGATCCFDSAAVLVC